MEKGVETSYDDGCAPDDASHLRSLEFHHFGEIIRDHLCTVHTQSAVMTLPMQFMLTAVGKSCKIDERQTFFI